MIACLATSLLLLIPRESAPQDREVLNAALGTVFERVDPRPMPWHKGDFLVIGTEYFEPKRPQFLTQLAELSKWVDQYRTGGWGGIEQKARWQQDADLLASIQKDAGPDSADPAPGPPPLQSIGLDPRIVVTEELFGSNYRYGERKVVNSRGTTGIVRAMARRISRPSYSGNGRFALEVLHGIGDGDLFVLLESKRNGWHVRYKFMGAYLD